VNKQIVESAYVPRDHALRFHARSERFAVMVMHRRAGKTVACVNDLIDKGIQCKLPAPRYGYVAPLFKQAKAIAWGYLKHYAEPLIEKVMESELSVILKNGARIQLYGADNPDALRGVYFDGLILDEYAQMRPRLFGEILAPTLADRKGWVVFIGTPAGPNFFYDLWQDAASDVRWFTQMLKASESGIIDAEELEMLATMPGSDPDTFEQEFECSFTAAVRGSYYGKLLKELTERGGFCGDFPYDPDRAVYTAFDIGYTDATSIWFYQYDGKTIRIIDFFSANGYEVADIVSMLKGKPYAYGTAYLPHDAKNKSFQTGKSTRELMIAAGMKTRIVPSLSVQDGIQAVRVTLHNCQFNTANPNVKEGLGALQLYQREWDDRNQMFKESPKHDWTSDPADAFRMLALAMNPTAAKKAEKLILSVKPKEQPRSNVYTLDALWADRKSMMNNRRI